MSTPEGPLCPRCGAPHGPDQEYCLECGYRLQPVGGVFGRLAATWQQRFGWYPGDWVWPVLLFLALAVAGAAAAIVLSEAGAGNSSTIVATQGGAPHSPTTAPETATVALPTVPSGTPSGAPSTPTAPPPATTTAPRPGDLTTWPAGQTGYTVVLESIPAGGGGRTLAFERARAASRAGLPQVGVLDSGRYSSLHPGYYVVFSGVYSSRGKADGAQVAANSKGFGAAYVRQITR
ncbi:MAG: zinc ribbon domain-containing protein [Actinobacteria bacterium]|nr:zinc ribbon domain-containing protein [Actinomycetota bacterium]